MFNLNFSENDFGQFATYKDLRFSFISSVEGVVNGVYYDSGNKAHNGIGFNLTDSDVLNDVLGKGFDFYFNEADIIDNTGYTSNNWQDIIDLEEEYETKINAALSAVYSGTSSERTIKLQNALNEIMLDRAFDSRYTDITPDFDQYLTKTSFTFEVGSIGLAEMREVFNEVILEKEKVVNDWLAGIPESRERAVLESLAYNNPSIIRQSVSLKKAIIEGDRAEAWYEIRYNTNGGASRSGGIANRRFKESELFGLYDEGMSTSTIFTDEALQIYQMYQNHRELILGYEVEYGDGGTSSTNQRNKSTTTTLEDSFKPAYDLLIEEFVTIPLEGLDLGIDFRDIQVADDTGETLEGTKRNKFEIGKGSETNDLLIGGKGSDVILGNGGNDVLHGGIPQCQRPIVSNIG